MDRGIFRVFLAPRISERFEFIAAGDDSVRTDRNCADIHPIRTVSDGFEVSSRARFSDHIQGGRDIGADLDHACILFRQLWRIGRPSHGPFHFRISGLVRNWPEPVCGQMVAIEARSLFKTPPDIDLRRRPQRKCAGERDARRGHGPYSRIRRRRSQTAFKGRERHSRP